MILWELSTRQVPYNNVESFQVPVVVLKGDRPEIPKDSPKVPPPFLIIFILYKYYHLL